MEEIKEEKEVLYDEAKHFLEDVKEVIHEAKKMGKKTVYASEDLLILSLEDDLHTVYEVFNRDGKSFASKLVYIGDKKIKTSYLLNLIHKQELKIDPHYERNF